MRSIITFINEKGGVGKTSACFNVAWELANRGNKVLMIDMDGQKANLTFFCGIRKNPDMASIADVFKKELSLKQIIIKVKENLDLVPADIEVANLDMSAKVTKLKKAIAEIKDDYDYIFMDVNPTPGWGHYLSLSISDYAIVLMLPDITSLEANKGIFETVEEIQDTNNPNLKIMGLLFNKNNDRTVLSKQVFEVAESMALKWNTKVFKSKIRQSVALSENVMQHEGITDYAPTSQASNDFKELVDEIEVSI